jgi:hypothetical protein
MLFDRKKLRARSFDRNFIWPKTFSGNYHLTEKSFDRKVIWPKVYLTESLFRKMLIWPKGHLTDFFFLNLSFSKNCRLTDCSYTIRIVHVPNFFVAARRSWRKKWFLYYHYYYSNRVENMIKVTFCNELKNLAELFIFIWGTAPGSDETSGQSNSFLVRCRFKNEKCFPDSNDESRLFYLLLKTFSVKWPFFEKTFGQMNCRWNDLSIKRPFFGKSFRWYELSVKCTFVNMSFRSFD